VRQSTKERRVAIGITVDGEKHSTKADADTPLLYVTPVAAVEGRQVTTLEGLPAWYANKEDHPIIRLTDAPTVDDAVGVRLCSLRMTPGGLEAR
jgi:hypothetical protein